MHTCIHCRFGAPRSITSDQGREFVNSVCKRLFDLTSTQHKVAQLITLSANCLVKRYNQTIQRSLIKLVSEKQNNWDMFLDGVLFAYRTSAHKSTAVTPFELMLCR